MLARSRQLRLGNSVEISTPLLIPSMSSLALAPQMVESTSRGEPELGPVWKRLFRRISAPWATTLTQRNPEFIHYSQIHSDLLTRELEESLLVSAYDIEHGLLKGTHAFKMGFRESDYAKPRLLVIDSGGYENKGNPSGSPFGESAVGPFPWEESDYVRVIDTLDREAGPAVVNWDNRKPYAEQIQRARDFFDNRKRLGSVFLLKPPEGSEFHNLDLLSAENVALLGTFDIVGVTEREIGESIHDRLMNIARLRNSLDAAGVTIPIHVFGGLDPTLTPLYFAAGAEIFDGLGWLRYAYKEGVAMHRAAGGLLSGNVNEPPLWADLAIWKQNLREIRQLSEYMRQFAEHEKDWDVFGRHSECLRAVIESAQKELEA